MVYIRLILLSLVFSSCGSQSERTEKIIYLDSTVIKTYDGFVHRIYDSVGKLNCSFGNYEFYDQDDNFVISVKYFDKRVIITEYILDTKGDNFDTSRSQHIIQTQLRINSNKVVAKKTRITENKKGDRYLTSNELNNSRFIECEPISIEKAGEEYDLKLSKSISKLILKGNEKTKYRMK
jgi:hypothetical protein